MVTLNYCLNCDSIWSPGTEEHDWQRCSACGWTPGQPIDDEDDDEDDYDEFDDDGDDPNDSRNI